MNLSIEDKKAIVARNFFEDQVPNDPDNGDYQQLLKEMNDVSEDFLDTSVGFLNLAEHIKNGFTPFIKDGYVVVVNDATGYLLPANDIPEEIGMALQTRFLELAKEFPDETVPSNLVVKIDGWKKLESVQ